MPEEIAIEAGTKQRKVIIVDDGEDTAEGLAAILGLWGFQVRTASEG